MNSQLHYECFTEEQPPPPHPVITSVSYKRIPNSNRSMVHSEAVGELRHYQSSQLPTVKSMARDARSYERGRVNQYGSSENIQEKREPAYFNDPVPRKQSADKKETMVVGRSRNVTSSYRNKENEVLAMSPAREHQLRKGNMQKRELEDRHTGTSPTAHPQLEQNHHVLDSDTVRYEDMNEKLNILEAKFTKMRTVLANKRQDRRQFLQAQQRQRTEQQRGRTDKEQRKKQEQQRKSFDKGLKKSESKKEILKAVVTQVTEAKDLKYMDHNPYNAADKTYYVSEVLSSYKEHKSAARQHILHSIKSLKAMQHCRKPTLVELLPKNVSLSKKEYYRDKKTVVFDLDETLVHCNESLSQPYDIKIPIRFPNGESTEAGVNIRPYARELLRNLSASFEIIVFTASHACYANVVLDYLDPHKKYIEHRLFRQHCSEGSEGMYIKDLRILNRSLSSIVLVDNAAYSFCFQLDNAIPIIPYYSGDRDYELCALQKYIQSLAEVRDVREQNRRTFHLDRYTSFDDADSLVENLYL